MKKLFFLALFCLSITSNAQDKKLDSLYQALENHPLKDTIRFNLLITLADLQLFSNSAESNRYLEQAIDLAIELKNEKCIADGAYLFTITTIDQNTLRHLTKH
jgi:hypothetical protein